MVKKNFYSSYKVDHIQFMDIQKPEVSYILGLLWADGYLGPRHIRFSNTIKDGKELEPIFMKLGDWRSKIIKRAMPTWSDQLLLYTTNRHLIDHLNKFGYSAHNTSSACNILKTVPSHLQHYWFRGLIDGDGCWYFNKKHRLRQFQVTSNIDQDWSFIENLFKSLDISYSIDRRVTKKHKKKRSNIRTFGRGNLTKLGSYIYEGYSEDAMGLSRKYKKWLECIEEIPRS